MANLITHALSYTKEDVQAYFLQPLFVGNKAFDYFEILTNVKSSQKLDKFGTLDKITKAEASGFSGSVTGGNLYTQKTITVARMEAEVEQAGGAFYNSVKGELLKSGLNKDDISGTVLQQIVADIMLRGVQRDLERQIWFGDTASGSANYSAYSGIFKALAGLPAAQKLAIASGALGTDVAIAEFQSMIDAMPSEGLENRADLCFFASRSLCDNYRASLRAGGQELAYLSLTDGTANLSFQGIPIVEMGLWDTVITSDAADIAPSLQNNANNFDGHCAVLTVKNNIVIATDYEQVNGADLWYNKDEKYNRFRFEYVVGVNYKNDELTVTADSNS